jgi:hypothetical protein
MKQVNNNEVDLMLRALGGRVKESQQKAGPTLSGGNGALSEHLDADELNSFAEGMVPDPARTRYMEHLADCASCRGIVVGLTQAAGAASPRHVVEHQTGVSFWQKFGALFSSQVLRYAVPAIALAAIIGISLLALRQKQGAEFLAQNQPGNTTPSSDTKKEDIPAAQPSNAATPTTPRADQQAPSSDVSKVENKPAEDKGLVAQAPAGTSGTDTVTTSTLSKDAPPASKAADVRPGYAPEPNAVAPPPPPRPTVGDADALKRKNEELDEREVGERRQAEYQSRPADESGPSRSRSERTNSAPLSARRIEGGLAAGRGPSKEKKDSASGDDTETRTVSGRNFRRQGNSWIDTAYDSSRATVNVARSSEQFRALVADEPGIRAIASQLSGEVIVVWKGRAYRIR